MRLVIAEKAEDDLARIYADLRHRYDLETADHFRMRAEKALKQLGQQPEMGPHPGWATSHQQLRFWVISREPTTSFIMKLKRTRYQSSEFWTGAVMCIVSSSLGWKNRRISHDRPSA